MASEEMDIYRQLSIEGNKVHLKCFFDCCTGRAQSVKCLLFLRLVECMDAFNR